MSITLKEDKSLRIESYSLHDFVFEVAKAAKSGYSPVDTNDKYVQGFSSWFTCGMVHDDDLTDAERAAVGLEVKSKLTDDQRIKELNDSVEQAKKALNTFTTPEQNDIEAQKKTTRTTKKTV